MNADAAATRTEHRLGHDDLRATSALLKIDRQPDEKGSDEA